MSTWLLELLNDSSFLGSLIGALLSGLVAIFVLIIGIKHQNNLVQKEELGNFLKEATFLSDSLEGLTMMMGTYVGIQYEEESISDRSVDEEGFPNEELSEVLDAKEVMQTDIEHLFNKIKSVDRKAFTYDSFETYIKIINNCENHIEYFWNRSMKVSTNGVADILKKSNYDLMALKSDLDKHIEKEKKRYNKLI